MTVLTNGSKPAARRPLLDSAFASFTPKRNPATGPSRRRVLAAWLRQHAGKVKNAAVALVAFGAPTVAAYQWHEWAGLIATGAAVLLFDKAVSTDG